MSAYNVTQWKFEPNVSLNWWSQYLSERGIIVLTIQQKRHSEVCKSALNLCDHVQMKKALDSLVWLKGNN